MNAAGLASFNLLVNAAISMAFALLGVGVAVRILRLRDGRLLALLWSSPFIKAVYEVARGIPASAFFWAKLAGMRQDVGSFRVGLGITAPAIPKVDLSLGAVSATRHYDQSIADVLATGLARWVADWFPSVLGAGLAAVILLAAFVWIFRAARAARLRDATIAASTVFETRPLGLRSVRIVLSDIDGFVPSAGGLLRPWVCLPRATFELLGAEEREAVIAHEIAHLRFFDGPLLVFVELVAAAFFFVPGARRCLRALRAHLEIAADEVAARVVPRAVLASAILRIVEVSRTFDGPCNADGAMSSLRLFGERRTIAHRIATLLSEPPARGSLRLVLRASVVLALGAAVLRATTFGNP